LFDLGDDELERMALAWPKLDSLNLILHGARPTTTPPPRITLHGLATLLKHCPMRSELTLVLDARNIGTPIVNDRTDDICNRMITRLDVNDSPIGDPGDVARFLYRILPNLEGIDMCYGSRYAHYDVAQLSPLAQDYYSRWTDVSEMLETLQRESRELDSEVISDHDG
jgi:hypothetical protein